MLRLRRRLRVAVLMGVTLAAAGAPALAQDSGNTVGPPQLKDFRLPGERRAAPREQPVAPAPAPPPAPVEQQPAQRQAQRPADGRPRPAQGAPRAAGPERDAPSQVPSQPQDVFQLPQAPAGAAPPPGTAPAPTPAEPAPASEAERGTPFWYALGPAAALAALGAYLFLRRRRHKSARLDEAMAAAALLDDPPKPPRPEPVPRPWLELELTAERAASTDAEASVDFEMIIRNTGKSAARNIRINARMFNAGREQDKEIGAFFKTKGEGRKTHVIGQLPAGERGLVQGSVSMPREEMRALQVSDQLLFIPVVGVNLVYDWGEGRTGQTSKSYVIGRELGEESAKMGAFRLDLGPRVYRTVGQRQHNLAKRV